MSPNVRTRSMTKKARMTVDLTQDEAQPIVVIDLSEDQEMPPETFSQAEHEWMNKALAAYEEREKCKAEHKLAVQRIMDVFDKIEAHKAKINATLTALSGLSTSHPDWDVLAELEAEMGALKDEETACLEARSVVREASKVAQANYVAALE